MLSRFGIPRLSYAQLFSFQVLYSNNADSRGFANSGGFGLLGRKKGGWNRAILEVDFTMGTLFLQDKDRIIVSESFEEYKRYKAQEEHSDDTLVSVRFKSGQWEIMAQNVVEKRTLQHLLECIVHDMSPQEAAESGISKGLVGVDKEIMKYGLVHRRAKTAYKKDERFVIVVPGKLLLFKGLEIAGKHVRFVTSLFEASTRLVYGQLEFELIVPDSKSLNLLTLSAEELTGWIGAIEKSALFANEDSKDLGKQNIQDGRADKRKDPGYSNREDAGYTGRRRSESSPRNPRRRNDAGANIEGLSTNNVRSYEASHSNQVSRERDYRNVEQNGDPKNQARNVYQGTYTDSQGLGENTRQDNQRRLVDQSDGLGQTNQITMQPPRSMGQYTQDMGRRGVDGSNEFGQISNVNMQLPRRSLGQYTDIDRRGAGSSNEFVNVQLPRRSLGQIRNMEQKKVFHHRQPNDQRFENNEPGPSNPSANLVQIPHNQQLQQVYFDHPQRSSRLLQAGADPRSSEGCGMVESSEGCSMVESSDNRANGEQRMAVQGAVHYPQPGYHGENPGFSQRNTDKDLEGNGCPPVEPSNFRAEEFKRKMPVTTQNALVSDQLNQPLSRQLSLRSSPTSANPGIMKDLRQQHNVILFYMNLYRRGLVDACTQTNDRSS